MGTPSRRFRPSQIRDGLSGQRYFAGDPAACAGQQKCSHLNFSSRNEYDPLPFDQTDTRTFRCSSDGPILFLQVSQVGQVTGNLLASVTKAERKYNNNRAKLPVGVIVVGFRRPNNTKSQKMATPAFAGGSVLKGPNRAYHSHLVEFGTQSRSAGKSRRTGRKRVVLGGRLRTIISREKEKSGARSILSSFSTRGPFAKGTRGQYPKDFIATGTVRGAPAQHPLQSAFNSSRQKMQSVLDTEMRNALEKALRELDKRGGL